MCACVCAFQVVQNALPLDGVLGTDGRLQLAVPPRQAFPLHVLRGGGGGVGRISKQEQEEQEEQEQEQQPHSCAQLNPSVSFLNCSPFPISFHLPFPLPPQRWHAAGWFARTGMSCGLPCLMSFSMSLGFLLRTDFFQSIGEDGASATAA